MKDINANKLYKGKAQIFIPPGKKYCLQKEPDTTVDITDQNGLRLDHAGKSPGIINITTGASVVWAMNYQETNHHPSDPVPTEQPLESPPDIMSRMRAIVIEEISNKYGRDSEEMETMEEAMNFDLNDDGHIGSPYEVTDEEDTFIEEVIAQPITPPAEPPAQPASEPADAVSTQTDPPAA